MTPVLLLIALLIPTLPVWIWLERIVPTGTPARPAMLAGYSLLLGMLGLTLLMHLLSALGIPFSLTSVGLGALPLLLAGLLAPPAWRVPSWRNTIEAAAPAFTRWNYLLMALLLALIAARLIALGLEVGSRPVFAWDAKQHWTKQAKVFFELASTAPYVPLEEWLTVGGQGVYTNMHPDYPVTTPLLQTWVNTALGQWHDSLLNLPWLLMFIALGLVFYSQSRAAGLDALTASAGTYMVLSLPYLNTHVVLAGYADLLMAGCYLGTLAAFANWCLGRNSGQAILAALCGFGCLLIKNEGFYWLLSLLPGVVLALLGVRRSLVLGAGTLAGLLLLLWLLPGDMVIAGHTRDAMALQYRPQAWTPLGQSFFVHDNWHFLGYLFVAALVLLPWRARSSLGSLAPVAVCVLSAIGLYLVLYLMTRHSGGAIRFTSLNRVALQLMPATAFFTLLVYGAILREQPEKTAG